MGVLINAQDYAGRTALHLAVSNNNLDIIRMLLLDYANPNIKTMNGEICSNLTNDSMIKYLLLRVEHIYTDIHRKFSNPKIIEDKIGIELGYVFVDLDNILDKKKKTSITTKES